MAKYIELDALLAEIENRIKSANNDVKIGAIESLIISKTLNGFKSFIDTLEVKEVNIDKLCEFRENVGFAYPDGASEYQKQLACYRQGIKDVIKAQKGE